MIQGPVTGIAWVDGLLGVMGAWGYLVAFLGGMLENLFVAGSFMPGETVVMAVAFVASRDPRVSILVVWFVSILGTMAGSNASYWIGHRGGRALLDRLVARFPRMSQRIADAEEYFEIHGAKTVFIARFTAGFKNFVPAIAGVTRMRLDVFEIYTALSALVYTTALALIGYYFGANMDVVVGWTKRAGYWTLAAVVVLAGTYVAYRIWRRRSIDEQLVEHELDEALSVATLDDAAAQPDGGSGPAEGRDEL